MFRSIFLRYPGTDLHISVLGRDAVTRAWHSWYPHNNRQRIRVHHTGDSFGDLCPDTGAHELDTVCGYAHIGDWYIPDGLLSHAGLPANGDMATDGENSWLVPLDRWADDALPWYGCRAAYGLWKNDSAAWSPNFQVG